MFHKITTLATLPNYVLLVGFQNGEFRKFDMNPIIDKYPQFLQLKTTIGLFEQAKIDIGGYGIVWNDYLDVSAEGVYERGTPFEKKNNVDKQKEII